MVAIVIAVWVQVRRDEEGGRRGVGEGDSGGMAATVIAVWAQVR